jgi:hypothetical protein
MINLIAVYHCNAGSSIVEYALHPERESAVTLAHIRQTVGEYVFASQYQQNPTPLGGAMVRTKWLLFYDPSECPRFDEVVQSWDTANKATSSAITACARPGALTTNTIISWTSIGSASIIPT